MMNRPSYRWFLTTAEFGLEALVLPVETHLWPRRRPQRSRGQKGWLTGSLEGSFDSMFIAHCVAVCPTERPGRDLWGSMTASTSLPPGRLGRPSLLLRTIMTVF